MFIFSLFLAASFSVLQVLAYLKKIFNLNLIRLYDTSDSSNLVEEVTAQVLFLDTKLFVVFSRIRYFKYTKNR